MTSEPSQHRQELVERLHILRTNESLCDVTITVKGKEFKAHNGVLAAASPFFLNLLTSNMIESQEKLIKIQLEEATVAVMEDVLKYIYTGNVSVAEERAHNLIATADYLLLPGLKTMVDNTLKETVTIENCIFNYYFAEKYRCVELKEKSQQVINSNFTVVMETEDFLNLDVKQVMEWVSSDDITVGAEEDVFKGIVKWVSHNKSEREETLPELLHQVRLTSLSHDFVLNELDTEELVTKNAKLGLNFVLDATRLLLSVADGQKAIQQPRKCLEEYMNGIFVCGGRKAFCYFPQQNLWYGLADSPFQHQSHALIQYKSRIFVFDNQSHKLGESVAMEHYIPASNSWGAIQCNAVQSNLTSCTVLKGFMYAIPLFTTEAQIYRYDAETNCWDVVITPPIKQENGCLVTDEQYMYIIGGKRDRNVLSTTSRFDPSNNELKKVAALSDRRYSAFGAPMKGKVYIAGGLQDSNVVLSSCEAYNPSTDEWQLIPRLNVPRFGASMVCFEGRLYVLGGVVYKQQSTNSRSTSVDPVRELSVEEFPEGNNWTKKLAIPVNMSQTSVDQSKLKFQACFARLNKSVINKLDPLK